MTHKAPQAPADKPLTLSDADITSRRSVTRRSLLGALGVSAGVAATAVLGTADSALAADQDSKGKKKSKKPPEEADSDLALTANSGMRREGSPLAFGAQAVLSPETRNAGDCAQRLSI